MCEITVRRATAEDIAKIAEIERVAFVDPWGEAALKGALTGENILLAAVCDGVVCGYATGAYAVDWADLYRIAVLPEYRGKGAGDALLKAFLKVLPAEIEAVGLEVRESNLAALSLYEKNGFKRVGLRRDFYRDPRENAVLMTKFLEKGGQNVL